MTLVSAFRKWIEENRDRLAAEAVSVTGKLPGREENEQTKGNVGLSKGHIIVSFTAWDRTPINQELIVYNTHVDKTVVMDDTEETSVESVIRNLDTVSNLLSCGAYDDLEPDRKLTIT